MSSPRVTVVGDALLDRDLVGRAARLYPDAPVPVIDQPEERVRPGGAGLAALLAARDGAEVTLVAPFAADPAAEELMALLDRAGVQLAPLSFSGTTAEKVRVRAGQQTVTRLDYGSPGTVGTLTDMAHRAIAAAAVVLVSDYGRGVTRAATVRDALRERSARGRTMWDPHPRGADPVEGATLVTPNRGEAELMSGCAADTLAGLTAAGNALLERWRVDAVAVTRGSEGALLVRPEATALAVPAVPANVGDTCGAGDRFAAAAAVSMACRASVDEAVVDGVAAASAFVAAGGAAALTLTTVEGRDRRENGSDTEAVLKRVRAAGGTVVATGGCFDLLHAGHVRLLQSARCLGDCLVVCMNSDASVRRLKGGGRPLVQEEDRRTVLSSLACVDAVVVFDEDTPERVVAELRPDVWAKGADYRSGDMPEASVVASWGGQTIVLPYLEGRSTTRILDEAARRARV